MRRSSCRATVKRVCRARSGPRRPHIKDCSHRKHQKLPRTFCGNSLIWDWPVAHHVLASRIAGLAATVILDANVMKMTPAPPAPFAIGATVRFLPDPDHLERVMECEWVSFDAAAHWRLTTTWT